MIITFTETINKVALICEDDKRVIQKDGIHTLTGTDIILLSEPRSDPGGGASLGFLLQTSKRFDETNRFVLFWRDLFLVLFWRDLSL